MSVEPQSSVEGTQQLLSVSRGDEPAETVLGDCRIVDVFSGQVIEGDVALHAGRIAGIGTYEGKERVELDGAFLAPGLIDGHVHIESAMVPPDEFARAVVPLGTTTAVTDPHEIANVLGLEGIEFMLESSQGSPLSVYVMASSCVPATHMETSGAQLEADDLAPLRQHPRVLGLAEVMNFPGVVGGDPGVMAKIEAFRGDPIDGHCPGLSGPGLNAYAAAGVLSDHECTTLEEAREKLQRGLMILIREATNARNLRALLPLVDERNEHRFCFCTDDRQPAHLLDEGHIDDMVRIAIAEGMDPIRAIRLATWNTARHFGLTDRGAVAPGYRADLIAFRDLNAPRAHLVWSQGHCVAEDGHALWDRTEHRPTVRPSMKVDLDAVDLTIPAEGEAVRVIGAIPNQLITEHRAAAAKVVDGQAVADVERDLLKMAVIERHGRSGSVGLGFVQGIGLQSGALASSVAHDHHNIVVVGADDPSMAAAAKAVAALEGGVAVARDGEVQAEMALPLAGLMSDRPIEKVRAELDRALEAATELGSVLEDPFMAMSFLALEVIPSLKLTDLGLVDVDAFQFVPLWADG